MRYVKFLSPEIVAAIVKDNEFRRAEWRESLAACGVDPSLYLWDGSPCAFPGVRRHAGSREINRLRDSDSDYSDIQDAICLDDNDYPKQVWSFVFRNAQFSNFGPAGYRLAHLIDHKPHNNRMAEELAIDDELSTPAIPGLYTCPSNTAYVCGGFIHPTDFNADIRNLLQRRAAELYSGVCNMLPPGFSVPEAAADGWKTSDFEWSQCVGTLDNMESFIDFRRKRMSKLIKKALESNANNDAKTSA